jgi:hypothetical protein
MTRTGTGLARAQALGIARSATRRTTACLEQRRFCPGEHIYAHRGHCTAYTPRPYVDDARVPPPLHARPKALNDASGVHNGVYRNLYATIVGD